MEKNYSNLEKFRNKNESEASLLERIKDKEVKEAKVIDRFSTYNTGAPTNFNVHYLMYIEDSEMLESGIKIAFANNLFAPNKEWIRGKTIYDIANYMRIQSALYNVSHKDRIVDASLKMEEITCIKETFNDEKNTIEDI